MTSDPSQICVCIYIYIWEKANKIGIKKIRFHAVCAVYMIRSQMWEKQSDLVHYVNTMCQEVEQV